MKTIFHIISRLDVGGAERVAISIAKSSSPDCRHHIVELQRGHSVFTRQMITELRENNIPLHRSWFPIYFHLHCYVDRMISILFPIRFLFLWLRYRPDVVHSHTEMPDMAVWLTFKMFPFMKLKVVRTIHNTCLWSGMAWTGQRVERFMQQREANVAISPSVQNAYTEHYGVKPPIILNGVAPVPQHQYDGLVRGKVNILFAARFEEQKGVAVLCSIVRAMAADKRYHFHIFGAGRQQHLVDTLRGMENVTVRPPLHNLAEVMRSFDYLIMPSLYEGLGILAIEASMNGLLPLINRCTGLVDAVPEGWQLAVDDNNMEEWLHLFRDILPTCDREALSLEAREYAMSRFSIRKMQCEYERLYL